MRQIDTFLKIKKDQLTDHELQIRKLEHEQSLLEKDSNTAHEHLDRLERDHEWIKSSKE